MKITIEMPAKGDEDEIIIRCRNVSDELLSVINVIKQEQLHVIGYDAKDIVSLSPAEIYYFESVDNKVFAYCDKKVYEIKSKLYEIEETYNYFGFFRISKSAVVNIKKISSISPLFNGKLTANLANGEKIVISRQYVADLKRKLGIKGR